MSVGENLYTVDPFTGAFETEVTRMSTSGSYLPNVSNTMYYDDIDMRSDGRLFTIESGQTGNGFGRQEPDTLMLSTEDARNTLQRNDTGITFYRRDPNNANALQRDPNGGIQFEAIVNDWNLDRRNIYAVGNAYPSLSELDYENLMYVLDPSGVAYTHPNIPPRASGAREYSGEKIPLGRLYTAPTLVLGPATQTAPAYDADSAGGLYYTDMDIEDGEWIDISDGTTTARFEFEFGRDYFLDPDGPDGIRDGQFFTVTTGTGTRRFEFDTGPGHAGLGQFHQWDPVQNLGLCESQRRRQYRQRSI